MNDRAAITRRYQDVKSLVNDDVFALPRELTPTQMTNCRILPSRYHMLRYLPKHARVAELGTQKGEFAKKIWQTCAPRELHLYDLSFHQQAYPFDRQYFSDMIDADKVILHEGDSSTSLAQMPDGYFDWIYIDADHSLDGVVKDIAVAKNKIKARGFLVFNDYTIFSALELFQYGVHRAVNDLCLDEDYEIVYLALSTLDYHDVCLRRRQQSWRAIARRFITAIQAG